VLAMKTLSGRFRFIVFGVIVIVAVVSCCNYAWVVPGTIFPGTRSFAFVEIGSKQKGPTYVEWKDEGTLGEALAQVCGHHGQVCLCVVRNAGDQPSYGYKACRPPAPACPNYECPPANIRTVKVTKSKAADNIAAGESAANDPNITYRVTSPDPRDITKVLGALQQ
jgi:hypothetical protein